MLEKREWLIALRQKKGLTQEEVAAQVGMHPSAFTHIENGTRNPSVNKAKLIASVLEFDWTKFFLDK